MDKRKYFYLLTILSALSFFCIHYLIERQESLYVVLSFFLLGICYLINIRYAQLIKLSAIVLIGILFRLIFFFNSPTLSEDVYRYIWDGKLQQANIPIFSKTPKEILQNNTEDFTHENTLYLKLNSKEYYSVYPPVSQLLFYFISIPEDDTFQLNIIYFRLIIFTLEAIALFFLFSLVKFNPHKNSLVALWWFNPLLIVEGTGNLHLEILVASLLIISLYFIYRQSVNSSALAWAFSFLIKLNPLIMLPALSSYLSVKKIVWFAIIFCVISLVFFSIYLNVSLVSGLEISLSYYFSKFEFNASIYYLLRWIGYQLMGYNTIAILGPLLGIVTFAIIIGNTLIQWIKKKQVSFLMVVECMQSYYFVYLTFSTTVHPWYVIPLVSLSAITKRIYPIAWSVLIPFTYIGYNEKGYSENYLLLFLEYGIVFMIFLFEKKYDLQSYLFPKLANNIN